MLSLTGPSVKPRGTIFRMSQPVERLAEHFKPQKYQLFLQPDREQLTFTGRVVISGELTKPTTIIKLHAKGLRIDSATFSIGGPDHNFIKHTYGDGDVLYLVSPIKVAGQLTIALSFFGEITEPMVGLYLCRWQDAKGQEKQIVATQFESHHAREVFPCIDEPSAKAVFELTLKTPAGDQVLANTPRSSQIESDGWVETSFEPTPIMSTYLLAFVHGELVPAEATSKKGTQVRVWTTPVHAAHTNFALDTAVRALDQLEEFFGLDFPLSKIDHVALPDFAAGAMENWGLITYREAAILVDPKNTPLEEKQTVATVIAHELSHQWFGNLVTMDWWTDLWLNEGFASWLEVFITDKLYPEWQMWQQFLSDAYLAAQSLDALASSHPIEVQISDPAEIPTIFDAISYDKGACVIRMLYDYLGHDDFVKGLRAYLQSHTYANATTADLWAALQSASGRPVAEFMRVWTSQTGYPLITAEIGADQIQLGQSRFLYNPESKVEPALWPVPLDNNVSDDMILMDRASQTWPLENADKAKLNYGQDGFYVVAYDSAHWQRLTKQAARGGLQPADTLGLINDAFKLAKAGQRPTSQALDLVAGLSQETDAVVWEVMAGQLGNLRLVFSDEDLRRQMRPYLLNLAGTQLRRLGWQGQASESHFDKLLRPLILGLAATAEETKVIGEVDRRFDAMTKAEDVEPDLRGVVFGSRARRGQPADYDKLLMLYQAADSPQVQNQLAGGLCAFRQPELIKRSLELISSGEVRMQDVLFWLSYLLTNIDGRAAAWAWIKDNWNWLVEKFGDESTHLSVVPKLIGRSFASQDMLNDYRTFFSKVNLLGLGQPIAQGEEGLEWQAVWYERELERLGLYFEHWQPPSLTQLRPSINAVTPKSGPPTSTAASS